eukprot:g36845.t1
MSSLADFLYPMPVEAWRKDYWHKKAFAVAGPGLLARFSDLMAQMHDLDLEKLVEDTPTERIFVWMQRGQQEGKLKSFEVDNTHAALTCHAAGGSLYFRAPAEVSKLLVRSFNRATGLNFGGVYPNGDLKGEVETFVSRTGHETDWHFDFMENFTIQLRGRKRWRFVQSTISHPMRGCTPHYAGIDAHEQQLKVHRLADPLFTTAGRMPQSPTEGDVVELQPGCILYHPAGIWHRVECTEDSLSINVSLIGLSWADFLTEQLQQQLWKSSLLRQPVNVADGLEAARETAAQQLERLKEVVAQLRVEDILPSVLIEPHQKQFRLDGSEPAGSHAPKVKDEVEEEEEEEEQEGEAGEEGDEESEDLFQQQEAAQVKAQHQQQLQEVMHSIGSDTVLRPNPSGCLLAARHLPEYVASNNSVLYILHFLFGNNELESGRRVELLLPKRWEKACDTVMDRAAEKGTFTPRTIVSACAKAANPPTLQDCWKLLALLDCRKLLAVLVLNGYLHVLEPAASLSHKTTPRSRK